MLDLMLWKSLVMGFKSGASLRYLGYRLLSDGNENGDCILFVAWFSPEMEELVGPRAFLAPWEWDDFVWLVMHPHFGVDLVFHIFDEVDVLVADLDGWNCALFAAAVMFFHGWVKLINDYKCA